MIRTNVAKRRGLLGNNSVTNPVGADRQGNNRNQASPVASGLEKVEVRRFGKIRLLLQCGADFLELPFDELVILFPVGVVLDQDLSGLLFLVPLD